jgi:hypothetical protein
MRKADMEIVGMKFLEVQNLIESRIKKRASRAIDLRRSIATMALARPNFLNLVANLSKYGLF